MDQQHSDSALAGGLFVFVRPATVVGESLAFEEFGIVGRRLVDQHQQNFATNVDTLVVVPVVLRSFNAVSHEDDLGVHIGFWLLGLIVGDVLIQGFEIHGLAPLGN